MRHPKGNTLNSLSAVHYYSKSVGIKSNFHLPLFYVCICVFFISVALCSVSSNASDESLNESCGEINMLRFRAWCFASFVCCVTYCLPHTQ